MRASRFVVVLTSLLLAEVAYAQRSVSTNPGGAPSLTTLAGTLEVVQADDFNTGRSDVFYYLIDEPAGKAYEIRFEHAPKGRLLSGSLVQVQGYLNDADTLTVPGDGTGRMNVVAAAAAMPSGAHAVAVIVVDFVDAAVSLSPAEIAMRVFADPAGGESTASVMNFFSESSYGQVTFAPDTDGDGYMDVFGPYMVNSSSTDACDFYSWAFAAEDAAIQDGVDLSLYKHLLFVIPTSNTCGWEGIANIGCGTQCRAWVDAAHLAELYAHELGHNLGMRDASTDTNNDGTIESTYGDYSDIMGYSSGGWRQHNAPNKDQMGWFSAYPDAMVTITQSGTFRLAPLEWNPWECALPQVATIYKPDTEEFYYLSYRLPIGYDATLRTAYAERLSVHHYRRNVSTETAFVQALQDGESLTDLINGLTITQVAHSADAGSGYVEFAVSFDQKAAQSSATPPTVLLSPNQQSLPVDGGTLEYTVSVTNNAPAGTASVTYSLSALIPAIYRGGVSPSTVNIAPGMTASAILSVVVPAGSPQGSFSVGVAAEDISGHQPAGDADAVCTVDGVAPAPVTDLTVIVNARKGSANLTWSAAARGQDVAGYMVYRDTGSGFVALAWSNTNSYADHALVRGASAMYYVTVVDGVGNESAPSNSVSVGGWGGSTSTDASPRTPARKSS